VEHIWLVKLMNGSKGHCLGVFQLVFMDDVHKTLPPFGQVQEILLIIVACMLVALLELAVCSLFQGKLLRKLVILLFRHFKYLRRRSDLGKSRVLIYWLKSSWLQQLLIWFYCHYYWLWDFIHWKMTFATWLRFYRTQRLYRFFKICLQRLPLLVNGY
jgi:hypothetical protein